MKDDVSLVEQTQRDILEYISKNNSNAQLPKEQEFVGLLGVSRVVVREALSRLRALGIIETKRKKGTVVVVPEIFGGLKAIVMSGLLDRDTLRDLYQLRLMLEIGMADFVFRNKNEEIIRQLEEIVACEVELERQLIRTEDDDEAREIAEKLRDVDIQFHSTLFETTANKSLMDFQYLLRHLFSLYAPRAKKDFHSHTIVTHVGLFNLLPIPPLDGSKVLGAFLPDRTYFGLMRYERYGMFLLLALSWFGVTGRLISGAIWRTYLSFVYLFYS